MSVVSARAMLDMISFRTFAHSVLALVVVVMPTTVATAATTQTTSSKTLLLSPNIHAGWTIAWTGRTKSLIVDSSKHGPVEVLSLQTVEELEAWSNGN